MRRSGASRWRLVRPLLTESTLLSVSGATLGVLLSVAGVRTLMGVLPADNVPPGSDLNPDMRIVLFAMILALAVGVCFGFAPAMGATLCGRLCVGQAPHGNVISGR